MISIHFPKPRILRVEYNPHWFNEIHHNQVEHVMVVSRDAAEYWYIQGNDKQLVIPRFTLHEDDLQRWLSALLGFNELALNNWENEEEHESNQCLLWKSPSLKII